MQANIIQSIKANKAGMGLSTKIALGFAVAVAVVLLVGVIAYFVSS